MILGLDISSNILGYAILSNDCKLIDYGHIKFDELKKGQSKSIEYILKNTRQQFIKEFSKIISQYKIENIYIEKPYTFFKQGGSSAHTMSLLIFLNGIIADWVADHVCEKIAYIDSKSVKKALGLKYSTSGLSVHKKRKLKKEKTIYAVKALFDNFKIRITKRGKFEEGLDDEADAIGLTMCHFLG